MAFLLLFFFSQITFEGGKREIKKEEFLFPKEPIEKKGYVLSPGDIVEVLVSASFSFSYVSQIDPQGMIELLSEPIRERGEETEAGGGFSFRKIAFVEIADMTIDQAEKKIEEEYKKYIRDAKVTMRLVRPRVSYVYVSGEVVNPGAYPYAPNWTVADYIGMAGGFTHRASGKIKVYKKDGKVVEAGLNYEVSSEDRIEAERITFKWWEDYLNVASVLTAILVTWLVTVRR